MDEKLVTADVREVMTRAEFLKTRSRAKLFLWVFWVMMVLQFALGLFATDEQFDRNLRTARIILLIAQVFCASYVVRTKTQLFKDSEKAFKLARYREQNLNA